MRLFLAFSVLALVSSSVFGQEPPALNDAPRVRVMTTAGNFVIELDRVRAPLTVESFLANVTKGFYSGTVFHRVLPELIVQGGGVDRQFRPRGTLPPVVNESSNGLRNERGTVAAARTEDPDSAQAQRSGSKVSPQGYGRPSLPRAAASHSAPVGRRPPSQVQHASAASRVRPVAGWSASASAACAGATGRPVASRNARKRALVTGQRPISTRPSSAMRSSPGSPIA